MVDVLSFYSKSMHQVRPGLTLAFGECEAPVRFHKGEGMPERQEGGESEKRKHGNKAWKKG